MRKFISMILVLALLLIFSVPAFADLNPDDIADDAVLYTLDMENYTVLVTFEDGFAGEWMSSVGDFALGNEVSFMDPDYTVGIIVDGEDALSGNQSFRAKGYLDGRRWGISLFDGNGDYIFYEYKIKVLAQGDPDSTLFYVCITEPDFLDETRSESSGGKLAEIRCGEETPYVVNREGDVIYTFPTINEVYTVACAIPLGGDTFDLFINGVRVSENNPFACEVNNISAMRWDLHGAFGDKEAIAADTRDIVIDDIILTVGNYITKADYFKTPEPTPEPTATPEPTDPPADPTDPPTNPTDPPVDATDKPDEKDNKGCGQVIISSAAVMAVAILGAAIVLKKKH